MSWKRVNINITEEQWRKLHRAAGEQAIQFSEMVRQALDTFLTEHYSHYYNDTSSGKGKLEDK